MRRWPPATSTSPLYKPMPDAVHERVPELAGLSPYEAQRRLWAHYCSLSNAGRRELIKEMTGARNVTIVEVESLSDSLRPYDLARPAHPSAHRDGGASPVAARAGAAGQRLV